MRDHLIFVGLYGLVLLINFACNYYYRPKQLYEPYQQFDEDLSEDLESETEEIYSEQFDEDLSEDLESETEEIYSEPDDDTDYVQPNNYKSRLRKRKRKSI